MTSYDPGREFIHSVDFWAYHDNTSCWMNTTLEMINETEHIKKHVYEPYEHIFTFPPNITFGNTCLSAAFVSLADIAGWRFLYVFCGISIGVFLYFIGISYTLHYTVSLLASIVCCCNPLLLNMQNPDRNVIALMISVFLFYFIMRWKRQAFLCGFFASFLMITGLRHIPVIITLCIFYLFCIYRKHIRFRNILMNQTIKWFCIGSIFPLLVMILHFYYGGIQGAPFASQHTFFGFFSFSYRGLLNFPFIETLTRPPFISFPVFIYNSIILLKTFGSLFCALCICGLYSMLLDIRKRHLAISCTIILGLLWAVLGVQADWLNREKLYPLITVFICFFLFFIHGSQALFSRHSKKSAFIVVIVSITLLHCYALACEYMNIPIDTRIYSFYNIAKETEEHHGFRKYHLCDIPIFPDYSRFWLIRNMKDSFFAELPYNDLSKFHSYKRSLRSITFEHDFAAYINAYSKTLPEPQHITFNFSQISQIPELEKIITSENNVSKITAAEPDEVYVFNTQPSKTYVEYSPRSRSAIFTVFQLDTFKNTASFNEWFPHKIIQYEKQNSITFEIYGDLFGIVKPIWCGITRGEHIIRKEYWIFRYSCNTIYRVGYMNDLTGYSDL